MLNFDEATHTYTYGDRHLISVTQLMKKHGLSPDYGEVPESILKAKAEFGTLVHKEIEDYIKNGEIGFTRELFSFMDYLGETNNEVLHSELRVHNDIVAGCIDLIVKDTEYPQYESIVVDNKTTASLHTNSVSWQLSIYQQLAIEKGFKKEYEPIGKVYHFQKDGTMKAVLIHLQPQTEVLRLFDCERKGELFSTCDIIPIYQVSQVERAQELIIQAKRLEDQAKEIMNGVKDSILKAMENNSVTSYENDRLKISYIKAFQRETFDSSRFKKDYPEMAKNYVKTSNVDSSIKITLKD